MALCVWHLFLRCSGLVCVNESAHWSNSFAFHLHVYFTGAVSHTCLYIPAMEHHCILPILLSHPIEGRRLSWPWWLVTYADDIPVNGHPFNSVNMVTNLPRAFSVAAPRAENRLPTDLKRLWSTDLFHRKHSDLTLHMDTREQTDLFCDAPSVYQ